MAPADRTASSTSSSCAKLTRECMLAGFKACYRYTTLDTLHTPFERKIHKHFYHSQAILCLLPLLMHPLRLYPLIHGTRFLSINTVSSCLSCWLNMLDGSCNLHTKSMAFVVLFIAQCPPSPCRHRHLLPPLLRQNPLHHLHRPLPLSQYPLPCHRQHFHQ